ncbi:MAG TPA: molybdenum cofactor guanylyltransferase MobA [Rhodanobacteraceae bacterium]
MPAATDRAYPRERITGGVLAGGRATRMGGVDKGLVELGGRAMVEYVLDALRGQTSHMVINANRNVAQYQRYGVSVVGDRQGGFLGPLAGISSMLESADTEWLLTAPCDSPQVPADLGPRLWQALQRDGGQIAVADSGGHLEPVFALLPCALRPSLDAYLASGERRIRVWYQQQGMATADFSDCPEMFANINTLAERDALAIRLGATGG